MRKLRRSLATALLMLAMTTAALADGQTDMPKITPPPDGRNFAAPHADRTDADVTVDILTEFVIDIWQFKPSLF